MTTTRSGPPVRPRWQRRQILQAGALGLLGLSSRRLDLLRREAPAAEGDPPARACIFLFLFGGPSQIDLWDMKPGAPAEVRGEFRPIATRVAGIQVCEHLPRLAQQMDKVCLVRSMTHGMNVHGPACSEVFSGREYFGAPTTDQASEQDWPSLSAMLMRYGPARRGMPASVVLPWYLQFPGQARRIAGQTGGRMGEQYNALLLQGDLEKQDFRLDGFDLRPSVPVQRLEERRYLLEQLQSSTASAPHGKPARQLMLQRDQAYQLLSHRAGDVFDLDRESSQTRDAYGRTMVGQSLLMARRLVEAGVSLVTVNWEDETKIDGVNTCWDTHQDNFTKLKNLLCPIMDQAFSALLVDLDQRGLLETTMVVAIGEFGRTPFLGQFSQSNNTRKSGRDHWPSAFTALVAGGGVRGGRTYGSTDRHAAFVEDSPVRPADLSATLLRYLGVNPQHAYADPMQRVTHQLSIGRAIDLS